MSVLALLLALFAPAMAEEPSNPDAPPPPETPEEPAILEMPQVSRHVEAPYPEEAKAQGLEGTVLLIVTIDETGKVTGVAVEDPVGFGFDEAAKAAVEQMEFTPAMTAEGPIAVAFEFAYGFVLAEETATTTGENGVETPAVEQPVTLQGTLLAMGIRAPLERARVLLEGTDFQGTTDEAGHFELRGVPPGTYNLKAVVTGYVPLTREIEVVEGQVTDAKLWLRAENFRENEVVGIYHREKEEITRRTLSIDEVRRVPGTFGDPVKVVQTLPGAARSPFGTGLLIIRGSNPEDSAVYVDGVRIPLIYHLTGTTSVLSPELIAGVDYLPGGYSVQYGRSMGGVVDVKTKDSFERNKIVWGTDILDSQLYFEGNIGKKDKKHGLAVGVRRSYIDVFIPFFVKNSAFTIKPRYWDYQVKWIPHRPDDSDKLQFFVYGFNDLLTVRTPEDRATGTDQDAQSSLKTEYSSHRLLISYKRTLGEGLELRLTPSLGVDYTNFAVGDGFSIDSVNLVGELRSELSWKPHPAVEVVPGIDFIGGLWWFNFRSPFRFADLDDPLAEREDVAFDGKGTGWGPDLYLRLNLRPLKDRERLLIVPGVRLNNSAITFGGSVTGEEGSKPWVRLSADPRLAARFRVVKGLTFKGGTGIYHQPPQPYQSVGLGTDLTLKYEYSWQSDIGVEHEITPTIQWDLDLFYKKMDNLIVFDEAFSGFGTNPFVNDGVGRAYGMEVILRHQPANRFFGWISYTLSRSERRDHPGDDWYSFDFDQTHILSAQAGYDLPWDIGVSAQVQYVTGNPDSPYTSAVYDLDSDTYNPFGAGYNTERLPPFFQTSVRVDKLFTFKRWQLEAYVDLMNVLRGVNPEFTIYNYDYTQYAYVRGLPCIPNVGIEAKFWP